MSWPIAFLSDVITEARPGFASGANTKGGVRQIRMNNITKDGSLDFTKIRRVPPTQKMDSLLIHPGDVLFNATNSPDLVGKTAYFDSISEPTTFSNHFIRLRTNEDRLDGRYLARWLQFQFRRKLFKGICKQWVNQATVGRTALLSLKILLPPVAEQRRIAAVLNQSEALRTKRRETLVKLNELTRSIFSHTFIPLATINRGASPVTLGEVADIQGGLRVTASRNAHWQEVPYLRVANVFRDQLDLNEVKVLRVTDRELERVRLQAGDLLVVEGHGNAEEIGRSAIWNGSIPHCVHQNHLIRVRLHQERILPDFACHYLNSSFGRRHLLKAAKTTSGLNTISTSNVRSAPITIFPLPLQLEFARQVKAVDRLKEIQRAHLAELDALFESLQHRAFRGEL